MSKQSKLEKRILALAAAFALTFGIVPNVSAMHIMEGYLPGGFCIAWGVLCLPFLIAGFMSIKKTLNEHRNLITLLGSDPVRSFRRFHPGTDRPFVPGHPAGPRRPYHHRRQHLFHGHCRSLCLLWDLCLV